ncbi:MAG TPA: dehydrogenase [Prolixibacteraceae bacterium]|nr:dehydrogenase [Prolixibacteraceae bacterium]
MKKEFNIGIVGAQFMGRVHTNAWFDVAQFYDLPFKVIMKAACDIDPASEQNFAVRLGWQSFETSWEKLIEREDIDIVDICTPNNSHMPIAVAAAKNGKHVICEKPIAMDTTEAKQMLEAAEVSGVNHMVAFNYRRIPAIALAKKMIDEGKLGKIHHFNAVYYQDWLVDPEFPWVWRHDIKLAGSGAHGDMNAHTVDLARFLVGDIESVCGEEKVFIKERKKPGTKKAGIVTADDAACFLARFENGALGNFIATRFATGKKNFLRLEIFGSKGSLIFNLERLNELEYYSRDDHSAEHGFRNILVTENEHPYINRWWPPGHTIGWEHTFIHEIGDFLTAIANNVKITPDFYDGYKCQLVLDAVMKSSKFRKWIDISN